MPILSSARSPADRHIQQGQAAVEHVATVVLVAGLLAALSAWSAGALRAPLPPPLIEHAARPLGTHRPLPTGPGLVANEAPWTFPAGRDDEPIGRFLRGARDVVAVAAEVSGEFQRAFGARIEQRVIGLARHPIGTIAETLRSLGLVDPDVVALFRRRVGALGDYAEMLRRMSPREAALRVASDAGAATADLVLVRLTRAAAGKVARRGVDLRPRPPRRSPKRRPDATSKP